MRCKHDERTCLASSKLKRARPDKWKVSGHSVPTEIGRVVLLAGRIGGKARKARDRDRELARLSPLALSLGDRGRARFLVANASPNGIKCETQSERLASISGRPVNLFSATVSRRTRADRLPSGATRAAQPATRNQNQNQNQKQTRTKPTTSEASETQKTVRVHEMRSEGENQFIMYICRSLVRLEPFVSMVGGFVCQTRCIVSDDDARCPSSPLESSHASAAVLGPSADSNRQPAR